MLAVTFPSALLDPERSRDLDRVLDLRRRDQDGPRSKAEPKPGALELVPVTLPRLRHLPDLHAVVEDHDRLGAVDVRVDRRVGIVDEEQREARWRVFAVEVR